ncbi:MAG: ribonuclease HII [Candidatus Thermoplasmatota archaeon]
MICGIDEAGRGPVLGPLVVAAVAVASDDALREIGVRDSKRLSRKRREALSVEIRKMAKIEVISISAARIDALRAEMTMNEIEVRAFASLLDRMQPEEAYLDSADVRAEEFGRQVRSLLSYAPLRLISEHSADVKYPVVSAASIIAKTERDAAMVRIGDEIGEEVGSGYPNDPVTRGFLARYLKQHGRLPPHTRRSWETSKVLEAGQKVLRIDSFPPSDG